MWRSGRGRSREAEIQQQAVDLDEKTVVGPWEHVTGSGRAAQ
jgi:hypothetical protein